MINKEKKQMGDSVRDKCNQVPIIKETTKGPISTEEGRLRASGMKSNGIKEVEVGISKHAITMQHNLPGIKPI